ncbi:hypothetical protein CFHF_19550 [Caulobacter flavus]|uniref:DUF5655 domain-containing protein n=1 Tax=Caulobacter flavus TaxID=1679497 RepID=A0A2N5CNX4_9CAUL|nr:MmcQ/YjbR family DNA-binding protein [Caulobacter flavus]AYV48629.1 hypothetical protein C1707_21515 [Caulobacter flavus]PLR08655.1 hypothetical protein CFHF_19550 [Caulobacter flavus]
MTPEEFRGLIDRVAPGAQAKIVLETLRFRVGGKTFATLNWPERGWVVVKLSQAEQNRVVALSDAFVREPGRSRQSGITRVRLKGVNQAILAEVLALAWRGAYQGAPLNPKAATASSTLDAG